MSEHNFNSEHTEELFRLVSRQADGLSTDSDQVRLNELLGAHPELVNLYVHYLTIHGQLIWDAGHSEGLLESMTTTDPPVTTVERGRSKRNLLMSAATILLLIGGVALYRMSLPEDIIPVTHTAPQNGPNSNSPVPTDGSNLEIASSENEQLKPLQITHRSDTDNTSITAEPPAEDSIAEHLPADFSDDLVVTQLDAILTASWKSHDIEPSPRASDSEWVRRAYLTIAGRIPTFAESESFLQTDSPRKRDNLIHQLLETSEYSDHFATVWTNLLVGRTERPVVNREMLFEFMADSFQSNSPWIDTVSELITASGRNDENGATNFLLAHLNNQATPATAVSARLFLGEQISCVQCHDHPFAKAVRQEDYWALNAFFKDTVRVTVDESDSGNSRYVTCRLVDRPNAERITHFETLSGQQRAVLPKYDSQVVAEDSDVNRRQRLARLLASDSNTKISRSMVNRMWAHYFGYGFVNPIDDMGPHVPVSHPEALDLLSEAFVKSDYNLKRLSKWITATEAWQLSSQASNDVDVPEVGEVPLFSRVYPRRMTPEQVYESIRVAIRSAAEQPLTHDEESMEHRRTWVRQFARAYETDENDESLDFEGSITQAMAMMNGMEVEKAISLATQVILSNLPPRAAEASALERITLATLSRMPTSSERKAFHTHHQRLTRQQPTAVAQAVAVEDMMWACLNSSEFVLVH